SAAGRYTSARSTVPSGIGTGTSQSMRIPSLTSLRYSPLSIGLLAFGAEVSPGTTAHALPPVPPASHLPQMESICRSDAQLWHDVLICCTGDICIANCLRGYQKAFQRGLRMVENVCLAFSD